MPTLRFDDQQLADQAAALGLGDPRTNPQARATAARAAAAEAAATISRDQSVDTNAIAADDDLVITIQAVIGIEQQASTVLVIPNPYKKDTAHDR